MALRVIGKGDKERLGHASLATTQIYAHPSYRRLQEAAEQLGEP